MWLAHPLCWPVAHHATIVAGSSPSLAQAPPSPDPSPDHRSAPAHSASHRPPADPYGTRLVGLSGFSGWVALDLSSSPFFFFGGVVGDFMLGFAAALAVVAKVDDEAELALASAVQASHELALASAVQATHS